MTRSIRAALPLAALLAAGCGGSGDGSGPSTGDARAEAPAAERVVASVVTDALDAPWALAFLPDGRMLVSERRGGLRIVAPSGATRAVRGAPAVADADQGGLLDVAISPEFARDATIFLAYAEPADGGARTAVARAVLDGDAIRDLRVIFRQRPALPGGEHFGSRLAFARDGTLFVTLGDRQRREGARDLRSHLGKVVRIRADGGVPPDNPFVGRADALPEIWSFGHRNPQGATIEPSSGALWTSEHGPRGGDEIDAPVPGGDFGWPEVGYGREYDDGSPIGPTSRAGVVEPLHVWTPVSVAPSGMTFATTDRVPGWRGDLFVGALAGRTLVRLDVEGGRVVGEQRLLTGLGERIRDVAESPDGTLHLVTDSGRLMRVEVR